MKYHDATSGQRIAEVHDAFYASHKERAIDWLAELAADGRVLELGIGTGRMALPLAARGVAVVGIDASEAMIQKIRTWRGGAGIRVRKDSFATFPLAPNGEYFDLIS